MTLAFPLAPLTSHLGGGSFYVMRTRRAAFFLALLALGVVALLAVGVRRPATQPVISVAVLNYTNWHEYLCARVRITNQGEASVSYDSTALGPSGWVKAEISTGWNNDSIGAFTGSLMILQPGSNTEFSVVIPLETRRWQIGFNVRTASMRERAIWNVRDGWWNRTYIFSSWPRLLPDMKGPEREVQSEVFEVPKTP